MYCPRNSALVGQGGLKICIFNKFTDDVIAADLGITGKRNILPRDISQCVGAFSVVPGGRGRGVMEECFRLLVGRRQKWYQTSYNAQERPQGNSYPVQVSGVPKLRDIALV